MPEPPSPNATKKPRHRDVYDALSNDILSGKYQPGQKIPSEAALVKKFDTSRITVGRALRDLQTANLIERIAGSGSYVKALPGKGLLFGLLIPDLGETEIFDPICQGIANAPEAGDHALLWGHADARRANKAEQCWQLCRQFISRSVSGVFFAPLEFEANAAKVNRGILSTLQDASIPVVLLDRRPSTVPERGRADLVGLNNRQAGYVATEHLIQHGCKRIGFVALQGAESTVTARMAGYREALNHYGLAEPTELKLSIDADAHIEFGYKHEVEAFVCLNDHIAGLLMRAFLSQGVRIPQDVRLVGIDDVRYANLLPVPLTTVRQPCLEIGEAALRAMLDRVRQPRLASREILLDGQLVIRRSCGAEG